MATARVATTIPPQRRQIKPRVCLATWRPPGSPLLYTKTGRSRNIVVATLAVAMSPFATTLLTSQINPDDTLPGRIWISGGYNINVMRGCMYLAQVIGKMGIKSQPVIPFGICSVKGVICQRDYMLSKQIRVHIDEQGSQASRRGWLPRR